MQSTGEKSVTEVKRNKMYSPVTTKGQMNGAEHGTILMQSADLLPTKSFRCTKVKLNNITKDTLELIKTFKCKLSTRICVFMNQLWLPCFVDNSIQVLSLDGCLMKEISLPNIDSPLSLHPIKSDQLILAAESGLYILDSSGKVKDTVFQGYFHDVSVDGRIAAALSCDKVFVWEHADNKWVLKHKFNITMDFQYYNTIHLHKAHIYVTDWVNHVIHKYTLCGDHVDQFRGLIDALMDPLGLDTRYLLDGPYLCTSDEENYFLVVEPGRKNIVVLSDGCREFKKIEIDDTPRDVVIVDNKMIINFYNKLTVFKIQT